MGLRWDDERYVRLYTRDTTEWTLYPWEARALMPLLLRKVDRAGMLEVGDHGEAGIAAVVGLPLEVVSAGLAALKKSCAVSIHDGVLFIPNFIDAQDCRSSDAQRKRDQRERDAAHIKDKIIIKTHEHKKQLDTLEDVTKRDKMSPAVTSGHILSLRTVPSRTVPKEHMSSADDVGFDFEAIWKKYPRKIGKAKGIERCKGAVKTADDYARLDRAVTNYAIAAANRPPDRVKHFDSWMNTQWQDWIDPPKTELLPSRIDGKVEPPRGQYKTLEEHQAEMAERDRALFGDTE